MTFAEYIVNHAIPNALEFDCIIGDVDMPATLCWDTDYKLLPAVFEVFGDLLNSEINILQNFMGTERFGKMADFQNHIIHSYGLPSCGS